MTVIGIAVLRDKKSGCYLLGLRPDLPTFDAPNTWEFPGGKREDGESINDAIVREMKEELGIEVIKEKMGPAVLTCLHPKKADMILHFVLVEDWIGEPQVGPEHKYIRWMAPVALRQLRSVTTFALHYAMEIAETYVQRRERK